MLHSLAARAYLMVEDFDCSPTEAIDWVVRNLPKGLQEFYAIRILTELNEIWYEGYIQGEPEYNC